VELHNKETNMNINILVKMAQTLDQQKKYKLVDKITTAMMQKESMIFLLKAIEDAGNFNALVKALNNFYDKRDLDYLISENGLRTSNEKSLTDYQTSEVLWNLTLEDLENLYKPIKSLYEKVTISGTYPNNAPIKMNSESLNYYEIKEKLISLCGEIENFHSKIFDAHKDIQKPLKDLENNLTEKTIRDMKESNDPIPEE
jgi:hypothetical protein